MQKAPPSKPLPLWPERPPQAAAGDAFEPFLEPHLLPAGPARGLVLICPGGGYAMRAEHEGAPVARAFNAHGLHAAVVHYRVAPHRYPAPQLDLARALRLCRAHAPAWGIRPDRIAVCGFSAGGHLAASLGVMHARTELADGGDLDQVSCRPDALVLGYAVISADRQHGHQGSFDALLGPEADAAARADVSLELLVDGQTPPAFLWHTSDDPAVSPANSTAFADALACHGIPYELHVYPHGAHGLGLAPDLPRVGGWLDQAAAWLHEGDF